MGNKLRKGGSLIQYKDVRSRTIDAKIKGGFKNRMTNFIELTIDTT